MITDKHDRWPDLLGPVALAYNATIHTSTGYSPHERFYLFAPSCPLDAIVSTLASDPTSNADEFALQTFERLQEANAFVRVFTGHSVQRMKRRYDASVRPQTYTIGEKVLVYNPKKRRGQFAKWQSCWVGPYTIENVLNQINYVVKKCRGKGAVIHVDRMRKLPNELSSDNSDSQEDDMRSTSPHKQRHKDSDAAMETSTHCTITANCTDTDTSTPLFSPMDTCSDHLPDACVSVGLDICNPTVDASQSTHRGSVETAESFTTRHKPCPAVTKRPVRLRRRPVRFLETIQARRLINRNSAAHALCRTACCDVTAAGSCQLGCSTRAVQTYSFVEQSLLLPKVAGVGSVINMPRRRFLQSERDASSAESSATGSGRGIALDHSLGLGSGRSAPMGVDSRVGVANPVPAVGVVVDRAS